MTASQRYSGLRDYLFVLRVNWWVILIIAAISGGVAFYLSERKQTEYTSSALMAFQDDTRELELLGAPVAAQSAPDQLPATRAQGVAGLDVAAGVQRVLRTTIPPAILASKISAQADAKTGLVRVTAQDPNPRSAAQLANAFAREYQALVNRASRDRFARAARIVRARLHRTGAADAQLRSSYADQLARLSFLTTASTPARVLSRPAAVGFPVSKNSAKNAGLGAVLGLILGVIVAFVRDALDRRVRGSGEIGSKLELPVIGRLRSEGMGLPVAPTDAANRKLLPEVESFRIIRRNLDFLADTSLKIVAVTSAISEEGKSTVAASLAATAAATGRATLLLECDLRRPSLASRLGLNPTPGLTEYLLGEVEPADILQSPKPREAKRIGVGPLRQWPDELVCVPAGTPTDQPAELLGSDRFHELLENAASAYDLVVLDTSPLLPVADTLELLPLVDGILLCVRSGRTTLAQALAGKAAIDHLPNRPIGLVVTGLSPRDDRDYRTYYGTYQPTAPTPS